MKTSKPTILMNEDGVSDLEKEAVVSGIKDLLAIAEVRSAVEDIGVWRSTAYRNEDGTLKGFQSVDWYLHKGRVESRNTNQLNTPSISEHLRKGSVWMKTHHIVLVLCSDIYMDEKTDFVVGIFLIIQSYLMGKTESVSLKSRMLVIYKNKRKVVFKFFLKMMGKGLRLDVSLTKHLVYILLLIRLNQADIDCGYLKDHQPK